jgi:cell division protein FtsB
MTSPDPRRAASVAGPPPGVRSHFTGRAAVLAVVLCGIALSLAYPVREYISQRRQIDQLEAQSVQIWQHREKLEAENRNLHNPAYIAQQARDQLHMCLPTQVCYVIIGQQAKAKSARVHQTATSWYSRVWSSVREANRRQPAAGASSAGRPGAGSVGKPGAGSGGKPGAGSGGKQSTAKHASPKSAGVARSG